MKESKIEYKVCQYARSKDWLAYKFTSPSNRGVPDRIFIRYGTIFFVEFKSTSGVLNKLQMAIIKRLKKHLFNVYVIDSIEQGIELIDFYEKKVRNIFDT